MFDTMQLREDYRFFLRAFDCFEQERADRKLRTFADLIYDPVRALNLDKSQIRHIENKFSHVIIDEYQDVNEIQQTMMRWITGTRAEVMVIGDPSQCIYVWRGAKPEYIVSGFERDFGACKTYQLSRTFRYGHRISNLANHCINQNRDRPDALCLSAPSTPDSKITCLDESQGIGPIIDAWRQQGRKLEEIAVLPRLFSMAAGIEMELLDKGTPYRLVGSESILESPITNAVLGFMHLCHKTLAQHPRLPALVKAMLTVPPLGITQGEIKEAGYKIINAPQLASQVLTQMAAFAKPFQAGNLRKRAQIFNLFASISPDAKAETAIKQFASESGAVAFFSKSPTAEAADEKAKIIEALVFYAKKGDLTIRQFIAAIAKMEQAMQKLEDADDALLITSIHRAKGLEWPVVFIPGLKDGSFPFFSAERPMTRRAIEDERRLYYVGVTRAKEHLYLMHPRDASLAQAMTAGAQTHPEHPLASRFLFESNISLSSAVGTALANPSTFVFRPAEHPGVANRYMKELGCALEIPQTPPAVTVALRQVPPATPPPSVVYDGSRFALGDRVEHPKFGSGTVR
ncbi:MAG TPA: ATP-dependent helicase, partial [Nevskiaceae bacterium]|nr:ATP-dependent helicase [Nevskiaceae bacterium]